jgi:hypothetical protein
VLFVQTVISVHYMCCLSRRSYQCTACAVCPDSHISALHVLFVQTVISVHVLFVQTVISVHCMCCLSRQSYQCICCLSRQSYQCTACAVCPDSHISACAVCPVTSIYILLFFRDFQNLITTATLPVCLSVRPIMSIALHLHCTGF